MQGVSEWLFINQLLIKDMCTVMPLKVVPATFWLVCFLSLKESTFETRKKVVYFTSKAVFVLEMIKF